MNIYQLTHSHRHGIDIYYFKSDVAAADISCEDVANQMGIDYDPERGDKKLELMIIDPSMIHEYKKGD